jgi:hypothetical protein
MKTKTRKWIGLAMLCSVLLLPGTTVTGQQRKIAQATIPFQFWIGDNSLPAGDYEIEHVVASTLVLFRSKNGKTSQDAYMIPLDDSVVKPDQAKLVFQVQNGKHYLYAFWGVYGKRVMTSESGRPAPAIENRLDVPVVYR